MRALKLAAVLVFWALSFVLNEIALRDLGPLTVAAGRWLVTAGLILALLARRRQLERFRAALRQDGPRFFLLSLVGVTLLYALQVAGQTRTTAINAGLLANTVPIFTVLLAATFLQERLSTVGWLGVVIALLGAWVVSAGNGAAAVTDPLAWFRLDWNAETLVGDLLVLLSALSAAAYFVVGKDLLARFPPLLVTAGAATLGALTLLPLALLEGSIIGLTWPAALTVLALGVGPGLLANLWWWESAEWLGASRAAIYIYLIPLITMLFAVVILGETIGPPQIAGAALVLSGVWLAERHSNAR